MCDVSSQVYRLPHVTDDFCHQDDGSMSKERVSLEQMKNNKQIRVILISFKAGSTGKRFISWCLMAPPTQSCLRQLRPGLNLTACNNVILVDMWWNPALEDQAFDRAHRLGQTRDVNIYKLTTEKHCRGAYPHPAERQACSRNGRTRRRQNEEPKARSRRSHGPVQAWKRGLRRLISLHLFTFLVYSSINYTDSHIF